MKLEITAVIPTYNDENFIEKCLSSIANQTYSLKKIFVVDDGSKDKTCYIVKKILKKIKIPVKLVRKKHTGMRGKNVNSVLKFIKTPILWIVESDAYYDKNYLKYCARHFNNPIVAGVIGKIHCQKIETFLDKCRDIEFNIKYKNYKPHVTRLIRKNFLDEVGGLDEKVWLFDDYILNKEFKKRGYKLVFEPKANWYHNEKTSLLDITRQKFTWGYAYYNVFVRYPKWLPLSIWIWTAIFISFILTLTLGFLREFILLFIFVFTLYFLKIGNSIWKETKNPIYWFGIAFTKIYGRFMVALGFWLGLILRLFSIKIV